MKALLYQLDVMSRKLVLGVLAQRHCSSIFAVDHTEALCALENGDVDVALVDTQKDGLELIRAIRACERNAPARSFLIALTIADTPGNRLRCLEAGGDAVLPIPLRAPDLLATLDEAIHRGQGSFVTASPAAPSVRRALNIAAALERVEGDRALLEELLRLFLDECQGSIRQIRDVWTSCDARALGRLAHTLKGSAANVGADGVSEAAFALERLTRSGDLGDAVQRIADLEREIERIAPELDSFLKETAR